MARLVADIGGTHVRFALSESGAPGDPKTLLAADFPDLVAAADAYLGGRSAESGVFAVNGPVEGDLVQPTNTPWAPFSRQTVATALGLRRLVVINDFVAQALAMPQLGAADRLLVGGGEPVPDRPVAVIGPGTGLGVAALIPGAAGWLPVPSEGGHVSFAPHDEVEAAVLALLRRRFDHVSNERLLAGPGLVNMASALAELDGASLPDLEPRDVVERAREDSCRFCAEAIRRYPRMLGSAAGDLALTFLARGGVFVAGGVVGRLSDLFDVAGFRDGFVSKGRFRDYLEPIPTWLVTRTDTGLLGAASFPLDL